MPHTPPDSPATQCSPVPFARCRRQSHADSFDDACEESASAERCSKELMRGSLRVSSESQCKSSLSECGEVPGIGRELSREASEPFAYYSPPVSTGSVPCMRKVASKDCADKLQSALTWRTCKGSEPACQDDELSSSTARKAEEDLLESDMQPSMPASDCQLSTVHVGAKAAVASGEMPSSWNEVPDDILRAVFSHMPSAYVRVTRLVCKVRTALPSHDSTAFS